MSKLGSFVIFASGVILGSLGMYFSLKKRYEAIIESEIESVKETYSKLHTLGEKSENDSKDEKTESIEIAPSEPEREEPLSVERPYKISPDEFNEIYGYESKTLFLYSDGILTDDDLDLVEDIDETINGDILEEFRKNDDEDCVYIRNDVTFCDYEILKKLESYDNALKNWGDTHGDFYG